MNVKKLATITVAAVLGLAAISAALTASAADLNDYQKQQFAQMESNHKYMMDQALASGRISQVQADQMNKNFDAHLKNMKEYAANNQDAYGNGFAPCGGYGMMSNGYGMMGGGYGMMGYYDNSQQGQTGPGMMYQGNGTYCR